MWFRPSLAVPVAVTVALALLLVLAPANPTVGFIDSAVTLCLSAYATACAVLAARSAEGRLRTAWTILAVALAAWASGDLLWLVFDTFLPVAPFPSPADFCYLLFTGLAIWAMVHMRTEPVGRSRLRTFLDGLTVGLCSFLLAWIVVLHVVFETYRDDTVALGLAFLYPVADIVALAVAVTVFARTGNGQRGVLSLLVVAFGLATITDIAFAYIVANDRYTAGHVIDIGWAAALVVFAAAALHSRWTPPPAPPSMSAPSNAALWAPYLPLLLAGTVGPALVMTGFERIVVPLLMVTVCLRQAVAAWENRELLSSVADQALRDPLTGLANRTLFNDRLAHAMMLRSRDGGAVAVVSLDLDDFKLVNDSLGHPTADRLLVRAGRRVLGCVRPGDTVARLGGDEFILLLEGDGDDLHLVAQRVVEAFTKPFVVDGQELLLRPSVGVAVAGDDEPDLAAETLVERADTAMYAAKRSRSSRVHTFDAGMVMVDPDATDLVPAEMEAGDDGPGRGPARVRLLGELRDAIDHGGLEMVYQPKIGLRTGSVVGVEALLRWQHPDLGLLRPGAFMSLIRQHGLMRPVTDVVLDKVLDDAARWIAAGARVPVAVNLFAPFLRDTKLPDLISGALERRGLTADLLTLEVTEDLVLHELALVTAVLRQLRGRGVRVAIDDFGSGYSALSYMRDLPIDEIKLDRTFISAVASDDRAAAVVRSVIGLTHELDMTVVAEGVEDAVTAAWLLDHGCDIGQGYFFGRPTEPAAVPALLSAVTPIVQ